MPCHHGVTRRGRFEPFHRFMQHVADLPDGDGSQHGAPSSVHAGDQVMHSAMAFVGEIQFCDDAGALVLRLGGESVHGDTSRAEGVITVDSVQNIASKTIFFRR